MSRKFFTKLFTIMSIVTFFVLMINSYVQANTLNQNSSMLDELNEDEKIMKYDATTQQTTEVDMEELREVLSHKKTATSNNSYSTKPYTPASKNNLLKTSITPFSSKDSVDRITNTFQSPYQKVCRVLAEDSSGRSIHGSAAIVGRNIALTSAHVVFDKDNGNTAFKNWIAFPGYNNGSVAGSIAGWSQVYYSGKWMDTHSYEYDWAICVLQANIGDQVGWFGVQSYGSNSELNGTPVRVLGYPSDSDYGFSANGIYQYETGEKITSVANNYFRYSAWTFGGFSGGPIIRSDDYIVGVHYGQTGLSNSPTGVRITQNMINTIINLNS